MRHTEGTKIRLASRHIPLLLSLGFCVFSVLEARISTRYGWPAFPRDTEAYMAILLPAFLGMGAACLSFTGRSARLSLWVLALFCLSIGVSELNFLLPPDEYFTLASAVSPAVWTLFAVVCISYLGSDLLRIAPNGMSRTWKLALLIVAVTVLYGPLLGFEFFSEKTDNGVLRFIYGGWGCRVYYVYTFLCICIVIYEWISGTAAIKNKATK